MAEIPGPLLLVGGGRMGEALLGGWLRRGLEPGSAFVIEPNGERAGALAASGVTVVASAAGLPRDFRARILVLAVKPQVMADVLPALPGHLAPGGLVLSIAAGKPLALFEATFGATAPVVRVMPNTPAAIGRGISALFANRATDAASRALAERLMRAVGEALWLGDEEEMHAVTALSGGGPAYVCLLVEALAAAGERLGLAPDLAMRLARTTVAGSGALLEASDATPAALREAVTSPGGTTRAALDVLMPAAEKDGPGLTALVGEALVAAAERSRQLA